MKEREMGLIDRLDRKLRRYAVRNVTLYIIIGQVIFFLFVLSGRFILERVVLVPELVLAGQWWRLITFLFIPPLTNPIFAFFAWYLFVAVTFLFPFSAATNIFIGGSVFLAFAYLYPDFQLYIFFILPVKIKWLALLTWIGYVYEILVGSWHTRLLVLASISNFLLFFGRDIAWRMKTGNRTMVAQARKFTGKKEPFHRCATCGKTDISHPQMEFRYCSDCGGLGYCKDHIFSHEHRKKS
jgi:hypothetical protein